MCVDTKTVTQRATEVRFSFFLWVCRKTLSKFPKSLCKKPKTLYKKPKHLRVFPITLQEFSFTLSKFPKSLCNKTKNLRKYLFILPKVLKALTSFPLLSLFCELYSAYLLVFCTCCPKNGFRIFFHL